MTLLTTVAFGKKPLQVPSPLRILQSEIQTNRQKVDDYRDNNSNNKCNQNTIPPPPPASLSSSSIGLPPHVLIGCQREVFGWSILDSAFCSAEYANVLKSWRTMTPTNKINGKKNGNNRNADFVKLILLGGWLVNHWSILSSLELRETLRIVLADISNTNQDSIYDDWRHCWLWRKHSCCVVLSKEQTFCSLMNTHNGFRGELAHRNKDV